jgi:hypothetical protein
MATTGEKRWPPVGNFVATGGEKQMAIDSAVMANRRACRTPGVNLLQNLRFASIWSA